MLDEIGRERIVFALLGLIIIMSTTFVSTQNTCSRADGYPYICADELPEFLPAYERALRDGEQSGPVQLGSKTLIPPLPYYVMHDVIMERYYIDTFMLFNTPHGYCSVKYVTFGLMDEMTFHIDSGTVSLSCNDRELLDGMKIWLNEQLA